MEKLQCVSCGSIDFEQLENNTLRCSYCGSIYTLSSNETFSQIKAPLKMPFSFYIDGDILTHIHLNMRTERPKIIKVPKGIKAIKNPYYGGGVFSMLVRDEYRHIETTFENTSSVHRAVEGYLEEIILPEGLEEIGDDTFRECTTLERINIPSTVKIIGNNAFRDCTALHEITLPEGLTSLGGSVFSGSGLRTITIPGTVKHLTSSFSKCKELKSVTVLPGIRSIGEGAFYQCSALEHISLPDTLQKLGDHPLGDSWYGVFRGCQSLKRLEVPDSLSYFHFGDIDLDTLEYLYLGDNTFYDDSFERSYEKAPSKMTFDTKQTRMRNRRSQGRCQYCGGMFVGLIKKKCSVCGKMKDY